MEVYQWSVTKGQTRQTKRDYKWLPVTTNEYKLDYKWIRVTTSKNVGELSFLTFFLQVVNGKYDPGHGQNINDCEPNYNSATTSCSNLLKRALS